MNKGVIKKIAMWIFKNEWIPLGRLAPHILGIALGSKPRRVKEKL